MSYEYLDHEADVGIRAIGKSLEEMFEEGARALLNMMVDTKEVSQKRKVKIECRADSIETLFVEWLNEIIAQVDIQGMLFSKARVVEITDDKLRGVLVGEKINLKKHNVHTEVKAATYYGLNYVKNKKHEIECVLDI